MSPSSYLTLLLSLSSPPLLYSFFLSKTKKNTIQASEDQELQARLLAEQSEMEEKRQQRMLEQQRLVEKKNKEKEEALDSLVCVLTLSHFLLTPSLFPPFLFLFFTPVCYFV